MTLAALALPSKQMSHTAKAAPRLIPQFEQSPLAIFPQSTP